MSKRKQTAIRFPRPILGKITELVELMDTTTTAVIIAAVDAYYKSEIENKSKVCPDCGAKMDY